MPLKRGKSVRAPSDPPPAARGAAPLTGRNPGGRPPKFAEARRPVTVTLPERTLAQLAEIDADRARAIVRITDAVVGTDAQSANPLELVEVLPGRAVILIQPCAPLRRIPGLHLVEVSPVRYLLALPPATPLEALEVALMDLLADAQDCSARELAVIQALRDLLGEQRRRQGMAKSTLLFVNTQAKPAN
ncbi:MAG: hypothetical protein K9N49_04210 [Candidatus Marinimicrobia bacterium]|nr:hypothetical protein [Candidatus Neomarinimicrobiota bacterium]